MSLRSLLSSIVFITFVFITCSATAEKPQRIVSLSLCTDQLLLMLVDKKRIAAVSYLATDPTYSYMWQSTHGIKTHHQLVEEIIPLKPDLIIAPSFVDVNTLHTLKRLGHNVLTFPTPTTLSGVEELTRAIGTAVREPERAETIIQELQNDIAKAKKIVQNKPTLRAISYGPNGYTAGKNTIKNEILEIVGYQNLAASIGIEYFGNVSLEQLVLLNPDIVIIDESIPNQDSLAQNSVNHPVITRLLKSKVQQNLPTSYWICPGPISSKAILAMAEQRL